MQILLCFFISVFSLLQNYAPNWYVQILNAYECYNYIRTKFCSQLHLYVGKYNNTFNDHMQCTLGRFTSTSYSTILDRLLHPDVRGGH